MFWYLSLYLWFWGIQYFQFSVFIFIIFRNRRPRALADSKTAQANESEGRSLLEEDQDSGLAASILEMVPTPHVGQLKHLIHHPLLMLEQLLMNGQIALATDLVKILRVHCLPDVDAILLRYASKALVLGLPEIQAGSRRGDDAPVHPVRKKTAVYVLPPTAPPKDRCGFVFNIIFANFNFIYTLNETKMLRNQNQRSVLFFKIWFYSKFKLNAKFLNVFF